MAKILYAWELGANSGHVTPFIELIRNLESSGHEIFFLARMLDKVKPLLKHTNAKILQSPIFIPNPNQVSNTANSFPKVLGINGYTKTDQIISLIKAWHTVYDLIKPDIALFNFAPTAALAARSYDFPTIMLGTNFYMPPDIIPSPGFEGLQGGKDNQGELIRFERDVLLNIGQALTKLGIKPLKRFHEITHADKHLFTSFKELDFYQQKTQGDFIGCASPPEGERPFWPEIEGPKIFIYLNNANDLLGLLDHINKNQYPTLAYIVNVSSEKLEGFASNNLILVDQPIDMKYVGETADIGICHGNHNTTADLLYNGIPVYAIPTQAEQHIMGRNIQNQGLGVVCPKREKDQLIKGLELILHDNRYKLNAENFSKKYSAINANSVNQAIECSINELLSKSN